MKTIEQLTGSVLTATLAPATKVITPNTATWAKWLSLETYNDPELEQLANYCGQFVLGVTNGAPPFWLSMLGKSGTGKTHCAKKLWGLAAMIPFAGAKYVERFIYWPEFVEQLREKVRESIGMAELLDMAKWPLLVLDDIGSDRDPSGFATDKLNTLLNMRVGRWTVITSNLDLAGLSHIDDRIASRIVREPGNLVIQMTTHDYGLRGVRG